MESRVFVTTLRDHFLEKTQDIQFAHSPSDHVGDDANLTGSTDDWTLKYIGVPWLQSIMEAFDDDESGWITISEVNKLTESHPPDLKWRYDGFFVIVSPLPSYSLWQPAALGRILGSW